MPFSCYDYQKYLPTYFQPKHFQTCRSVRYYTNQLKVCSRVSPFITPSSSLQVKVHSSLDRKVQLFFISRKIETVQTSITTFSSPLFLHFRNRLHPFLGCEGLLNHVSTEFVRVVLRAMYQLLSYILSQLHSISIQKLTWSPWISLGSATEFGRSVCCRNYIRPDSLRLSYRGCHVFSAGEPLPSGQMGFCLSRLLWMLMFLWVPQLRQPIFYLWFTHISLQPFPLFCRWYHSPFLSSLPYFSPNHYQYHIISDASLAFTQT